MLFRRPGLRDVFLVLVIYVSVFFFHCVRVLIGVCFVFLHSHGTLLDDKLPVWNRLQYDAFDQLTVILVFFQEPFHRRPLVLDHAVNVLRDLLHLRL